MGKLSRDEKKALKRAKRKEYLEVVKNSNKQRLITYITYGFLLVLIIVASSLTIFWYSDSGNTT